MPKKPHLNIRAGDLIQLIPAALVVALVVALCVAFAARAAEPLEWERRPNRPAPAQFDAFHGETLELSCTFAGYGALPFEAGAEDVRLWYQTNGMGRAWWSIPATVSSNTVRAAWLPSSDPGAERVTFFFGAPSNSYAAALVRFRNSPGLVPNKLDPPDVLDWQAELASVSNALAEAIASGGGLTTNAVCAIVTNVVELDEWTFSGDVTPGVTYTVDLHGWWLDEDTGEAYDEPGEGRYWEGEITLSGSDGTFGGPEFEWPDATSHTFDMYRGEGGEMVDAGRITATRKHVVRNALGLARLEDVPSTNGLVNADGVRDIVTNVVYSYSAWRVYRRGVDVTDRVSQPVYGRMGWDVYAVITTEDNPPFDRFVHAAQDALALDWTAVTGPLDNEEVAYRATRERASTNTLGLARLEDVPDVSGIAASVSTLWTYVYGGSVWIAVTNYMRTVAGVAPSFQLWEVRDGATNCVYSSAEEIDTRTEDMIHTCRTNLESQVAGVVAAMPDRAWSKYQSATGNESPDGVTIISTPIIQLTGGGEWYRYVDVSSNSVWFLRSNGVHTFGGDTNGYFRILDDEGNPTFEVRKTDSYTVDAVPESIHFDGDGNFCISFQSNIQPMIYTSPSLSVPAFSGEGEDPNITVTWSHAGGVYTATVEQTVKSASLFAYAKIEVQGTTVIRNTAPTDVSGGILCTDGIHKCRPRYTNGAITWEVVP